MTTRAASRPRAGSHDTSDRSEPQLGAQLTLEVLQMLGDAQAEIAAAENPEQKQAEILARLERIRSPHRTAEAFVLEEIIDPRDSRKLLCEFVRLAEPLLTPGPASFTMRP